MDNLKLSISNIQTNENLNFPTHKPYCTYFIVILLFS